MMNGVTSLAHRVTALARKRGLVFPEVETWEHQPPTPERLVEIMDILGVTLDTIFDPYQLEPGEAQWSFRITEGETE